MLARILCPGPSLARYDAGDFSGLLIGVNRAAIAHRVDVWACGDYPAVIDNGRKVLGRPLLLTAANTDAATRCRGYCWPGEIFEFEKLQSYIASSPSLDWPYLTFSIALVYAAFRGATSIEVYGADWDGEADFDGAHAGGNRSPARWAAERRLFARIQEELGRRGIAVDRIVHESQIGHGQDARATEMLKHSTAPEAIRPKTSPVHYGGKFDVWQDADGYFVLHDDGTPGRFTNLYEAIHAAALPAPTVTVAPAPEAPHHEKL